GRLATRRSNDAKFDHGAQFYRLKAPLREVHKRWSDRNLSKLWFAEDGEQHFNAPDGMTALAKDLAQEMNVILSERVVSIKRQGQTWTITFESGQIEFADEVVFTCPVPQSVEILKVSGIVYPVQLNDVNYTKALVVLIEKSPVAFRFSGPGYSEPDSSLIFSIADQSEKGTSVIDALTITLKAEFSESHFDSPDSEVINTTIDELIRLSPSFVSGVAQLKKWRYCQVQKPFGDLFVEVAEGVYLAGDGFGGASLNGAARSANALAQHLSTKHVLV
ncbi:MAG: hypothetical protein EOP05_18185, partial [Proteobacteria bacterium]